MDTEDFVVNDGRHGEHVEDFIGQVPDAFANVESVLVEALVLVAIPFL